MKVYVIVYKSYLKIKGKELDRKSIYMDLIIASDLHHHRKQEKKKQHL